MRRCKRGDRKLRTLIKHIKRLKRAYYTSYFNATRSFDTFMYENRHWLSKLRDTGTICSCCACGNPRKHLKELTKAEMKELDRFKEQYYEYFNTGR
jgi:hypothetical protein